MAPDRSIKPDNGAEAGKPRRAAAPRSRASAQGYPEADCRTEGHRVPLRTPAPWRALESRRCKARRCQALGASLRFAATAILARPCRLRAPRAH